MVGDCLEGEMLLNSEDWSTTRGEYIEKGGIELRMARDIYLHVKLVGLKQYTVVLERTNT
jgi:hypothetical protein